MECGIRVPGDGIYVSLSERNFDEEHERVWDDHS